MLDEFTKTVEAVAAELENEIEWKNRYATYAKNLLANESAVKRNKALFHNFAPLCLYMNIGSAISRGIFNLRYLGQAVTDLYIDNDGIVRITTTEFCKSNERDFGYAKNLQSAAWSGAEASEFRKFFKAKNKINNKGNEEHRKESLLLSEFSKNSAKDKKLLNIQPVRLFGGISRFQMLTPFSASGKGYNYSGAKGGGIDILCRVGNGANVDLCVMEVKDENDPKEPPAKVITQAIVYAVFLWKLLRSESGQAWYEIFGYKRKLLPTQKLNILVAAVMPPSDRTASGFENTEIKLNDTDRLILHTVYFEEKDNKITGITASFNKKSE